MNPLHYGVAYKMVKELRKRYFPNRHYNGDCGNIAIFMATCLKHGISKNFAAVNDIKFVNFPKKFNDINCALMVYMSGSIISSAHQNPTVDCVTLGDILPKDFVQVGDDRDYYLEPDEPWGYRCDFKFEDFFTVPLPKSKGYKFSDELYALMFPTESASTADNKSQENYS